MNKHATIVLTLIALSAGLAIAADEGIHITGGKSTGASLTLNDGAGFRWDIVSNGIVNDGTNDAYDTGMQLSVNNNTFYWSSNSKLSADGREIEMGPWNSGQVSVCRRIYVDPKQGYCRWIDIFENNTGASQTLTLQYYTNTGGSTQKVYTTTGKTEITDKDWGAVTSYDDSASNPSLVHIFASKNAKTKPKFTFRTSDDNLYYQVSLTVPAGKAAALCFFEAQRKPFADAKKFLDGFDTSVEMNKVPAALRKIIVNMTGGLTMSLGKVEIARNETSDLVVLRNGDEWLGTVLAEKYTVETFFGKVEVDAKQLVGINVPEPDDDTVLMALTDGQIIVGKLLTNPLKIKLTNGNEMSLSPSKFVSLGIKLPKDKPADAPVKSPVVVFRNGQQLFFKADTADLTYHTEYGDFKIDGQHTQAVLLDTPDGGLHRAIFRNGSVLSGLLKATSLKLQLDLGMTMTAKVGDIEQIIFPGPAAAEKKGLVELAMRNDDQLFGSLLDVGLKVTSPSGSVDVKADEIAELVTLGESLGQVQIKLNDGSTHTGKLSVTTLKFKFEPGPELPIFLGHITRIVGTGPESSTQPSTQPADPKPPTPPANVTPVPMPASERPIFRGGALDAAAEAKEAEKAKAAKAAAEKAAEAKEAAKKDADANAARKAEDAARKAAAAAAEAGNRN